MHTKAHERKICPACNRPTVNIMQILPSAKSQRISKFTFYCPALRSSCIHSSEGVKSRKRLVPDVINTSVFCRTRTHTHARTHTHTHTHTHRLHLWRHRHAVVQTARHKMAALMAMFSPLSKVDFQQMGSEIKWKTALFIYLFYSISVDAFLTPLRACADLWCFLSLAPL